MTPAVLVPILFSLLACKPGIPDCEANEYYDEDGNCIPRDTSLSDRMQEIVDDMPACDLLAEGDRLDLRHGCADGACAEDTYSHMVDVLGDADCEDPSEVEYGIIRCEWQDGSLAAYIWDDDEDGMPDGNESNEGLHLQDGWDGADEHGLGLDISLGCFVEVYGDTEEDDIDKLDDGSVYGITWPERGLYVHDVSLDGYVDLISIFGVY